MNLKSIFLSLLLLVSIHTINYTASTKDKVTVFSNSIKRNLGFTMSRFESVAGELRNFRAKRLTKYLSPGALALYDKAYNQILVEKEMLDGSGEIKSYEAFKLLDPLHFSGHIDTIFHEMTHAEYFNYIVKDHSHPDTKLNTLIKKKIIPWIEANEDNLENANMDFSITNGISEWQGYFVGRLVGEMIEDLTTIEKQNGVNQKTGEITITTRLKSLAKTLSKEEFSKFILPKMFQSKHWKKPYWLRVRPGFDVKGFAFSSTVSVEPSTLKKLGFKEEWWKALWDHFKYYTKAHTTIQDLSIWMANSSSKRHALKEVRDKYWESIQKETDDVADENTQSKPNFSDLNK